MTNANERYHLKIAIWIVLDHEGLILDRADGPEYTGSFKLIVIVETKYADQRLVGPSIHKIVRVDLYREFYILKTILFQV